MLQLQQIVIKIQNKHTEPVCGELKKITKNGWKMNKFDNYKYNQYK